MNRFGELDKEPGATVAVCPVRPQSRGSIMARSADPNESPAIKPNYLSAHDDLRVLNEGVRHARKVFAAPSMARYSSGEILPGAHINDDAGIEEFARAQGTTLYHPVGTCQMGEGIAAVVDSRLRVHGIEGLRVVDASVMPSVTTGNTNAPTIMIGEKAATMIVEDSKST